MMTQLSMLLLFYRIFGRARKLHIVLGCVAVLILCSWTSFTILTFWRCIPFEKAWITHIPGRCINLSIFMPLTGICNISIACLIVTLPITMVWTLNVRMWQKVEIVLMLTLGFSYVFRFIRISTSSY